MPARKSSEVRYINEDEGLINLKNSTFNHWKPSQDNYEDELPLLIEEYSENNQEGVYSQNSNFQQ